LQDIRVSDNYSTNPTVQVSSSIATTPGKYVITYLAYDSTHNETIERRVIKVEDDFSKYYQAIEYIESTGTQYIATDYHLNGNSNIELQFASSTVDNSAVEMLFGTRENDNKRAYMFGNASSNNKYYYSYYGESDDGANLLKNVETDPVFGKKYKLTVTNGVFNVSDIGNMYFELSEFTLQNTMYIFAANDSGNVSFKYKGKIYDFKIKEDDEMVRHYIPAIRRSDSKPGLYDTVNSTFYINSGSGEFTTGNPIN
jgi:hypothetical protein